MKYSNATQFEVALKNHSATTNSLLNNRGCTKKPIQRGDIITGFLFNIMLNTLRPSLF